MHTVSDLAFEMDELVYAGMQKHAHNSQCARVYPRRSLVMRNIQQNWRAGGEIERTPYASLGAK